ncbi:tagatose-bisphosphate aldolase [Cephaloticoccus primus]|uniref:Tagatose-bisphosphate aldolase n=1 Tax=Cephaloticoccus primus TaxID=1548207 RepID=A0A139STG9_9BACT|nr:D-tagatose-bisphosphate aldolase, class II, non-catalytic subunit [Cephaloticoccus primus]KXU37731.1 tagatose-bisphosphate aldolase [Cephaloticoccus primus]
MSIQFLENLPKARAAGQRAGITSVCSAHPVVIRAALRHGLADDAPVLIEATCNQVNQDGGYTGMTPTDFRAFVEREAAQVGFPKERILFGGDHLGPNPWKHLPAEQALAKAEVMIAEFVRAGFSKIHVDTSMGCLGEPAALADEQTAGRAVRLVKAAEAARSSSEAPVYIIGTEVPVPGGAVESLDHMQVTDPSAARQTVEIHRCAFEKAGLTEAWQRVIGLVVQPGVEFGHEDVIIYEPERAQALSKTLDALPGFVFEAHSTDYQPRAALSSLVRDGFVILKVGPELTFVLREALYGLDAVAKELGLAPERPGLKSVVEARMCAEPGHWKNYYMGTGPELYIQRHYSLSDRIRYYWPDKQIEAAVDQLLSAFNGVKIPPPLIRQYFPGIIKPDAGLPPASTAGELMEQAVIESLNRYKYAIKE